MLLETVCLYRFKTLMLIFLLVIKTHQEDYESYSAQEKENPILTLAIVSLAILSICYLASLVISNKCYTYLFHYIPNIPLPLSPTYTTTLHFNPIRT